MLFRVNKLLYIAFLLFAASAANASPTVTHQDAILTTGLCAADTSAPISHTINNVIGPINARLTNLGREFMQPPASLAGLSNEQENPVKPLPAVPTAMLMVLMGFICVSLVRDRRIYLAALAALLCAGHAGFRAVPQLGLHLCHRAHTNHPLWARPTQSYLLENVTRPRCDIEGTRYIGLLHHLAGMPNSNVSQLCCRLRHSNISAQTKDKFSVPQFAIRRLLSYPIQATNGSTPISERFVCLTPAFIFHNFSRGPPVMPVT